LIPSIFIGGVGLRQFSAPEGRDIYSHSIQKIQSSVGAASSDAKEEKKSSREFDSYAVPTELGIPSWARNFKYFAPTELGIILGRNDHKDVAPTALAANGSCALGNSPAF
jgi:hypothetical protein